MEDMTNPTELPEERRCRHLIVVREDRPGMPFLHRQVYCARPHRHEGEHAAGSEVIWRSPREVTV